MLRRLSSRRPMPTLTIGVLLIAITLTGSVSCARGLPGDADTAQQVPGTSESAGSVPRADPPAVSSQFISMLFTHVPLRLVRTHILVQDALTEQPIVLATVQINGALLRTNSDGEALFVGVEPGSLVTVRHATHHPVESVYGGEGQLTLRMAPKTIRLRFVDAATNEPIAGLLLTQDEQEIPPQRDGCYQVADWSPDRPLTMHAAGYRRHTFTVSRVISQVNSDPERPILRVAGRSSGQVPILEVAVPPFLARAIYLPYGYLARPDDLQQRIEMIKSTELNALVIDMKSDKGYTGYPSQEPLTETFDTYKKGLLDIKEVLAQCKEAGIYTIARQVVFKDHPLATTKPEWAVRTADGQVWLDREGLGWANPYLQEVRDYNIALAKEIAELGFDEIQFDYLRFPSDGNVAAIVYPQENTRETRSAAIKLFVEQITEALRPYGIFTSADVFGLTVWVVPESEMGIGQRVIDIAPYVDYLCPMVYPSTFIPGNLEMDDPSAHPYEVIYRSVIEAKTRVPPGTKVRPWLQAYWYEVEQLQLQKQGAEDSQAWGWSFWNAGGNYPPELFLGEGEMPESSTSPTPEADVSPTLEPEPTPAPDAAP